MLKYCGVFLKYIIFPTAFLLTNEDTKGINIQYLNRNFSPPKKEMRNEIFNLDKGGKNERTYYNHNFLFIH